MPPAIVSKRVRDLHAALTAAGWTNKKLPREEVERYLAAKLGLSLAMIRVHIDTGRVLGLWSLVDRRPRPTLLLVHPENPPEVGGRVGEVHA